MKERIDLVWLARTTNPPGWPLGRVMLSEPTPAGLNELVSRFLPSSKAAAWVFWDPSCGIPDPETIRQLLSRPGDVWHAGLKLDMAGLPGLIDFVAPTWMLNRDPDIDIEATSWRLSLRACLIRTEVLRQLGALRPGFETLDGAALELGHRYITCGVFVRHVPWMITRSVSPTPRHLPFSDEVRLLNDRYGRFWTMWALARALLTRYLGLALFAKSALKLLQMDRSNSLATFSHTKVPVSLNGTAKVSVIIPTLNRYRYLRKLLEQLSSQTVPPFEIIVADQTPLQSREFSLKEEFACLPLKMLYQEQAGQCSSRNAALRLALGDYLLLVDDDVEITETFIQEHLESLFSFRAEVSSGEIVEIDAREPAGKNACIRASDVFPAGNTMACRQALVKSGLFDLAYERGQRADGDLGMRTYLSGALMVLNPSIRVIHHHAPQGGLREHRARVITYGSSRRRLTHRHLPSTTEVYLAKRYFSRRQVREMLWLGAFGTFSVRGGSLKKLLKAVISGATFPDTLRRVRANYLQGSRLLDEFPQIGILRNP